MKCKDIASYRSVNKVGELLRGAGFSEIRFEREGRVAALADSMPAIARKP